VRARNLKPSFFHDAELVELGFDRRLLFAGLWCLADRSGRLRDRPKQIKVEIFPADNVEVDACLADLAGAGLITRYQAVGESYIQVRSFSRHQNPHHREPPSVIPAPDGTPVGTRQAEEGPRRAPANTGRGRRGRGKAEGEPLPHGFDTFWQVYPRKDKKTDAAKAWKELSPDAELQTRILEDVTRRTASPDWQKEKGRFIPLAGSYLRGCRWEDEGVKLGDAKTNGHTSGRVPETIAFAHHNAARRREAAHE